MTVGPPCSPPFVSHPSWRPPCTAMVLGHTSREQQNGERKKRGCFWNRSFELSRYYRFRKANGLRLVDATNERKAFEFGGYHRLCKSNGLRSLMQPTLRDSCGIQVYPQARDQTCQQTPSDDARVVCLPSKAGDAVVFLSK